MAPEDVTGQVVDGRYRLGPVIGRGGMGSVRRGWHEKADVPVAVKLFEPVADRDELVAATAEARALSRVHHPNLVELYDVGRRELPDGTWQMYLVLELVDGPALTARLREGPLDPGQVAVLGRGAASGLAAVHDAGVVHRDVKPGNLLLTGDERAVKVADFGIARVLDATRLTLPGTTLGTASYLSPEQAAGREVRSPSDVYSLALVLIECLTGAKAFSGTIAEVAAARLLRDPELPTGLPLGWAGLLRAMTDRDPGARPSAMEASLLLSELVPPDRVPDPTAPAAPAGPPDEPTVAVPNEGSAGDVAEALIEVRRGFDQLGLAADRRAVVEAAIGLLDDELHRHSTRP